jgi:outer membrane protein TolC
MYCRTITRGVTLLVLAGVAASLASCKADLDKEDRAIGRAQQKRLAEDFRKQIALLSAAEKTLATAGEPAPLPANLSPWWRSTAAASLFEGASSSTHSLEDLYARALIHSQQIRVFSDIPLIRRTGVQEARGRFDTHLFVESAYEYTDEPVGSILRTGRTDGRFKQYETRVEAGARKKLLTGADVTVSQKVARTVNNSAFFVPDHQASARLALTIIQPLLRGGGVKYNRSFIQIAKIDSHIARSEFVRQAESHLLEITRAYWTLYLSRALAVQKRKLQAEADTLVGKLSKRQDLDAMASQLQRAKAAQAKRRADLVRADMAIKNAEDRIKALINDPELMASSSAELLPADSPRIDPPQIDLKHVAAEALENRPEIRQAFLQLKAAAVRKKVSKNELLPQLDLIMETSIAGLDRAGRVTDGWDDQWKGAHPGFLVGLRLDMPVENNVAKARHRRRKLEIRQQIAQLRTTVDTVLLEAKISAREVTTSFREMQSRHQSLAAAREDVRILQQRWESHAGAGNKPAIGYIELLIEAQDRLAEAEEDFARSTVIYNVATINLQRAQGTLLKYEELEVRRIEKDKGPDELQIRKIDKSAGEAPTTKPS